MRTERLFFQNLSFSHGYSSHKIALAERFTVSLDQKSTLSTALSINMQYSFSSIGCHSL